MDSHRIRTSIWLNCETPRRLRKVAAVTEEYIGEVVDRLVAHEADRLAITLTARDRDQPCQHRRRRRTAHPPSPQEPDRLLCV